MRNLLYAFVWALGCAHAPDGGASLGADHSYESGDLYGSATDDTSLPSTSDRLAALYDDEPPETTAEGPVVLWAGGGMESQMVAVSRDLPAGSVVRVTRVDDGRSIVLEVAGREPLPFGLLALSADAGRALGLEDRGQLVARVEVLSRPEVASR